MDLKISMFLLLTVLGVVAYHAQGKRKSQFQAARARSLIAMRLQN